METTITTTPFGPPTSQTKTFQRAKNSASATTKESTATNNAANLPTYANYVEHTNTEQAPVTITQAPTSSLPQAPKPLFCPIPDTKPCNINIDLFQELLKTHPDQTLVHYIIDGLRNGFDIGFTGQFSETFPKKLRSAEKMLPW